MNRFSKADIETIRHMAARRFGGVEIAKRLSRTPQSIRVKCVELGVGLRPRLRILFEPAFYDALMREAKARATTPAKLARLLLVTLLSDNMVSAVLDMPVGKGDREGASTSCPNGAGQGVTAPARVGADVGAAEPGADGRADGVITAGLIAFSRAGRGAEILDK